MSYLYLENVDPRDRFSQLSLLRDNGSLLTLTRGRPYDLSMAELDRARRFVVMIDSTSLPADNGGGGTPSSGSNNVIVTLSSESDPNPSGYEERTIWWKVI